jgi:5-amino-6-(5-phosphoribosylamino)uracil reductase
VAAAYLPAPFNPHGSLPQGRPWVTVNMVTSVDGAVSVGGVSGGLQVPGDGEVFGALRSMADAVLVGAGTVRAENYGPVQVRDEYRNDRAGRHQTPVPRLVVVTNRGDLPGDLRLFDPAQWAGLTPPLVLTTAVGAEALAAVADHCEIRVTGEHEVDLGAALAGLRADGVDVVVCEGGPQLNASLMEAGLLDELCVTLSPLVAAGTAGRIVAGDSNRDGPVAVRLGHLLEHGGALFARWCFTPGDSDSPVS